MPMSISMSTLRPTPTSRPALFLKRALGVSAAALALAACTTGKPGGIYSGTITSTTNATTYNLIGAVDEDGGLDLINTSTATPTQYSGQITVSKSKTTGTATLNLFDATGAFVTTGNFKGQLGIRSQINGTYTTAANDSGTLTLNYNAQYASPVTLATAAGTYMWTSTRNGGVSTLTFNSDGSLTGTTEYGCPFTGTATVPNTTYDLFDLSLTTTATTNTACVMPAGTALGGLAYYTPASGTSTTGATLTAAAASGTTSGTYGYFANYVRQ